MRYKQLIGCGLRARSLPARKVGAAVGCKVINIMTSFGSHCPAGVTDHRWVSVTAPGTALGRSASGRPVALQNLIWVIKVTGSARLSGNLKQTLHSAHHPAACTAERARILPFHRHAADAATEPEYDAAPEPIVGAGPDRCRSGPCFQACSQYSSNVTVTNGVDQPEALRSSSD
jgi:hypothetical protein